MNFKELKLKIQIGEDGRTQFKLDIRNAVEEAFDVKVTAVNTHIRRGKMKRVGKFTGKKKNRKFAVVTLAQGENITFHEGVV